MAFAALYDADVLIPHEIRDTLMILASTRLYAVYWSDDILEEWLRNAASKRLATKESVLRFQRIMNEMFPDALIARSRYEPLMKSMTNQEKDRHVLAAAVVAEIDVLVTNNVDDFPKESIDPYNIEVQTADQFVRQQAALNPAAFLDRFLSRARERNKLSLARGDGPVTPQDLALFLRDGPSEMVATGQFIMDLLRNLFTGDK